MKTLKKETQKETQTETELIHEKMAKYFKPTGGQILIEYARNLKTSGGVFLPTGSSSTKAMAHPVIAVGPDEKKVKPGDWVALRNATLDVFPMYDREFSVIRGDFEVMLVVDMNYMKDEAAYKEAKNKAQAETPRVLVN